MKQKRSKQTAVIAGFAALTLGGLSVQAQSVDALLDKLVDKGVLSTKEANQLKEEADQGFTKSYQVKSGMPDWVTALKINGDFRGRVEGFTYDSDNFADRMRYRYRLRLGVVATMHDNLEAGFRLTSSETPSGATGGDPISGNSTFQDNGSKKLIFIDLAYGKWTPINNQHVMEALTIGKMENPFLFSDMVFDNDYTPEGLASTTTYNLNSEHALKFNAGAFVLDEIGASAKDPYYFGAQVLWDAAWSKRVSSTLGLAGLNIVNSQNLATNTVPNVNIGNSRANQILLYNYNPLIVNAMVTYMLESFPTYRGPLPIKAYGEFLHNPAVDQDNSGWMAGVGVGKSGKRGTWALDYRYKYLESDAWYEELVDSDYGALYTFSTAASSGKGAGYNAGTGIKGHVIRAGYSPYDALTLQLSYWRTQLIDDPSSDNDTTRTGRVQVDAIWKF